MFFLPFLQSEATFMTSEVHVSFMEDNVLPKWGQLVKEKNLLPEQIMTVKIRPHYGRGSLSKEANEVTKVVSLCKNGRKT